MNSGVDPTDSEYVYMTVYQYVGTSLATGLNVSGSTKVGYNPSVSSHQITGSLLLDSTAFKYGASTWKESSGVNELTGSSWEFQSSKGSGDLYIFIELIMMVKNKLLKLGLTGNYLELYNQLMLTQMISLQLLNKVINLLYLKLV